MKKYKRYDEALSKSERKSLEKELDELDNKIKTEEWLDPKWFRRKDEIISLLMSDGKTDKLKFAPKKPSKSKRVTSFTRTRK
jgi:hypothetical protein